MNKKQVYCRYCGKLIDEDAKFCTYCGKTIYENTTGILSARITDILSFTRGKRLLRKLKSFLQKNARKICLVICTPVIGIICFYAFAWTYSFYLTSKWAKYDLEQKRIAMNDLSKSVTIAKTFFKEDYEEKHYVLEGFTPWCSCEFCHKEAGLQIIRNAAEKGNADAQFTLGAIYAGAHYDVKEPYFKRPDDRFAYTMLGENIDFKRAVYWYTLAAKQGHVMAMNNLGQAYREGEGVEQNYVKATELIRTAAEQGNPLAQLTYGDMFRDGEACYRVVTDSTQGEAYIIRAKPNIRIAKEWWEKALKNGNEDAKDRLEQVYE